MKKYSIEQFELLLLQNINYAKMEHFDCYSEFYRYGMLCSNFNNTGYELKGYLITKTPAGFVMLHFPDGTRCQGVSQERLNNLFNKCEFYYVQQSTQVIKNFLDDKNNIWVNKLSNGYTVKDMGRYTLQECFNVTKNSNKYLLQMGIGVHADTDVIPQGYIQSVYNDVSDIYLLQNLNNLSKFKDVKRTEETNENHKYGIVTTYFTDAYDITLIGDVKPYKIRNNQDSEHYTKVLTTPTGKAIQENCGVKTALFSSIINKANCWVENHQR